MKHLTWTIRPYYHILTIQQNNVSNLIESSSHFSLAQPICPSWQYADIFLLMLGSLQCLPQLKKNGVDLVIKGSTDGKIALHQMHIPSLPSEIREHVFPEPNSSFQPGYVTDGGKLSTCPELFLA